MFGRFKHRGLKRLWENGKAADLNPQHVAKLGRVLDRLNEASKPEHMALPGWRLHPLKGKYSGFWAVTVQANWRLVFRFENGDATDIDYIDYH